MNLTEHEAWFRDFACSRILRAGENCSPLELKLAHTFSVLENARSIARAENFSLDLVREVELAALYHDVARFDQYLEYGTFKDALSASHGPWGVKILKRQKLLAGEKQPARRRILTAVGLHNRLALPRSLDGDLLKICQTIRDADKLDILRVMHEHLSGPGPYNPTVILSLPDDPALVSQKVVDAALGGYSASYGDLTSVNDFRLLLGTWYYDMNFNASRDLFKRNGHAFHLVSALPATGPYQKPREKIVRELVICKTA